MDLRVIKRVKVWATRQIDVSMASLSFAKTQLLASDP